MAERSILMTNSHQVDEKLTSEREEMGREGKDESGSAVELDERDGWEEWWVMGGGGTHTGRHAGPLHGRLLPPSLAPPPR